MKSSRVLWLVLVSVTCAWVSVLGGCSAPAEVDGQIKTGVSGPGLDLEQDIVLCETNADCADFERGACEMVICQEEGYCIALPLGNGTLCDDGNVCTVDEVCEGGFCGGGVNDCPCESDEECVDKSDGDLCEGGLVCINGGCALDPAGPVVCDDVEGDCVVTTCDPATGGCVDAPTPDGAPCATDNACLAGATCMEGACQGGSAVECPEGESCVAVTCDSEVGCVDTPTNEGEACNDGNPCSTGDTCSGGLCVGEEGSCECDTSDDCLPFVSDLCTMEMACEEGVCVAYDIMVDCPDVADTGCAQGLCDPATGACGVVDAPDGSDCASGAACDVGAVCQAGECVLPDAPCEDDNPCTSDECDEEKGCTNTPLDGGPCDDGNPCSSGDSCVEGSCWPGQDICVCEVDSDCAGDGFDLCLGQWSCDQGACVVKPNTAVSCDDIPLKSCQVALCEPSTGECSAESAPEGELCDDGNNCTTADVCASGLCAGVVDDCDDGNACTDDSCKPTSGCKHTENNKPCDDDNACTSNDFCISGSCFGGAAVQCSSGLPCTEGICDPVQGCVAQVVADGADCDDGTDCTSGDTCTGGVCSGESVCDCLTDEDCQGSENGNLCDGTLACVSGACEVDPNTVVVCASGGPCETGACEPDTGDCSLVPSNEGKSCDPGPCLTLGVCAAGTCSGKLVDCEDGNPCTVDKCNLNTGLCDATNKPGACDDSDPCTLNESCKDGVCSGGLLFPCDDDNPCTTDVCVPGLGCEFTAADCDDGDACTADSCGADGACLYEEKICGDASGDPCQTGYCEAATGQCVEGQAPDGEPCSDQNPCTTDDQCLQGACLPGTLDLCDDGNSCTVDICAPTTGCQNEPIPCESDDPCISASCEDGGCVFSEIDSPACNGDGVGCTGPNGSSCNDLDGETSADICVQGICRGFKKQILQAEGQEGNVRVTGVNYAYGHWFMNAQIFGGNYGTVNELLVYGTDEEPTKLWVYEETALAPAWTELHEGFAIHEGGELWRYDKNTDTWSGENELGDLFIENNLVTPKSIWVHKISEKELRLWAVGEPNSQAYPVLMCSEKKLAAGGVEVECSGQKLNEYPQLQLKAVAGTAECSANSCGYHLLLGADLPGDFGDFTDVFENSSGFESDWFYAFNDPEPQDGHTTHDVAALGDSAYLIAGGGGYVRHRASNGDLTWLPSLKTSQSQRDFRGVWSGAGTVVMAATRDLNSGPDAEIWTASVSSNPTSESDWAALKLGDLAEGAVIHDVWGNDLGSICVVGEELLANGTTGAIIFRR